VVGDNVTSYRQLTLLGRSDPLMAVQVYANNAMVGGTRADSAGNWSAATTSLADGTYNVTAAAFDNAGNKSPLSSSLTLRVGGTQATATAPGAPTGLVIASAGANGIWLGWKAPSNGGSQIAGYVVYRGTSLGSERPYVLRDSATVFVDFAVSRGVRYYYRVAAANGVGLGPMSAEISVVS
jgi:fibronectin type 3 domain-containing protein